MERLRKRTFVEEVYEIMQMMSEGASKSRTRASRCLNKVEMYLPGGRTSRGTDYLVDPNCLI